MMKRRTFIASTLAAAGAASLPEMGFGKGLAPFKLFDTHAHFYTNQPDKYPFQATGARYGAERMIAKAAAKPMTPEAVFAFWDQVGIERGTGVQYNSTYGTDNSYLLDCAKAHPEADHPGGHPGPHRRQRHRPRCSSSRRTATWRPCASLARPMRRARSLISPMRRATPGPPPMNWAYQSS